MEVHHHPQVEKKSIKEYLLEGLMIFLAETMGFFAENIREHFNKKEKEEQYMRSFAKDLSNDMTYLPNLIKSIQIQQLEAADSLPILMKSITVQKPANKIYFYIRGITRQQPITVFITDRTIVQLKNASEMRLISNQQISDSLIDYYKNIDFISTLQGYLGNIKNDLAKSCFPLIDSYSFDKVSDSLDRLVIPKDPMYLRSVDAAIVNNLLIEISSVKGLSRAIQFGIRRLINEAGNIRNLIMDNYQLDADK